MWTAFVLVCSQSMCFAIGGPAFQTEEQCAGDVMSNGISNIQLRYPQMQIVAVMCQEWEPAKVQS